MARRRRRMRREVGCALAFGAVALFVICLLVLVLPNKLGIGPF